MRSGRKVPLQRYRSYRRQRLPLSSGITEAACNIVFTQRLKRLGMSWTIADGQVILGLSVLLLSDVWKDVTHRYFGGETYATNSSGQDERRSKRATGSVAHWECSNYTRQKGAWVYENISIL